MMVYSIYPFDMALIGEEVSGILYVDSLTREDLIKGGVIVPMKTAEKRDVMHKGIPINLDLILYPV